MWLEILNRFHTWLLTDALNLVKIIVVAALLVKLLRWTTGRFAELAKRDPLTQAREQQIRTMSGVMNSVGTVLIVALAGMMALREIGLDVRPILAGAGVLGLAVGFGAQSLVRDVIHGFFILVENQYGIGDVVRIGNIQGAVEQLTLRRTQVRDSEGALHTIPNGEIRIVANLTRDWAQVNLSVAVGQGQDVDRVAGLLREVGREMVQDQEFAPLLQEMPRVLGVDKFTGSQVELLVQVRVQPGRQFQVSRELRRRVKLALDRAGIAMQDPQDVRLVAPQPHEPTK